MDRTIPTAFYKVDINPRDICPVRFILNHSNGKFALVKDKHLGEEYHLGRVKDEGRDASCYEFVMFNKDGSERVKKLLYHDITGLLLER